MEKPTLHLIFSQGPRKGEALVCKPGSLTRIGRVVRGNTLAIKDPGVSQKHLSFQFIPETSRWAVSDLDTSNGTLLNGAKIPPSAPTPLSDGDSIKIGEMTTISVKVAQAKPPPAPEAASQEEDGPMPRRRRGAPLVVQEHIAPVRQNGRGRRNRAAPARVLIGGEVLHSVAEESIEVVEENAGRGRQPSKKAADSASVLLKEEILDSVAEERIPLVAENAGRGRQHSKNAAESANVSEKEEILDSVVEESVELVKNGRRGRPMTRAARSRSSKAEEPSDYVPVSATEALDAAQVDSRVDSNAGDGDNLVGGRELGAEKFSNDMDSMTLGEWFDRMEVYLPQAINDFTDEIIASLRETSQRFDEYITNGSKDRMFREQLLF